ncbi:PREDICTED: agamous-like MADS-box protein AGL93 [Brassica oleracea var. oleracea]|uniref:MADS-box domain-containing protein n=1 Tax=Brassica oleracea var. oleracea TaxID=109376 RepID=A0A0D3CIT2_BRAOL|nr:PREDICTED: agamous-like MADS-box protein AGL93 [Brassica oleracea var. oleracea]
MASSSSFLPSSSSLVRQNHFQKTSSLKATSLAKRQVTVFKKARELSILCGIEVCVIYYGSDGELKTWPKDREKVKDMARRYSQLSDMKRRKGQDDLDKFLKKINKEDSKKKKVKVESSCKYLDWDPRFDNCSVEQLTELIQSLEHSETKLQHRLRGAVESQRQRNMYYTTMAGQEQMNHLQQHSDQVSMDQYNHGTGTLPQLAVSTSAFNQSQSLAPLPNSLTIHHNPNMESYSRLLGVQETGMNELLSMNMLPYNNINTNNVNVFPNQFHQNSYNMEDYSGFLGGINNVSSEDYSGLLWTQGTGISGLQNMDMFGYNNNNNNNNNAYGFSNQLVQYQGQRTPPGFQYMDRSTQNIRPL